MRQPVSLALWWVGCADEGAPRPDPSSPGVFPHDTAGVPPWADDVGANAEPRNVLLLLLDDVGVDRFLVTLAELVERSPTATWSTSYVGKWHLAACDSASSTLSPIVQGWDWWSGSMANLSAYDHWKKVDNQGTELISTTYAVTDNIDDALGRVEAMPEPWLMQIVFNGAHTPFHVPPSDLHPTTDLTIVSPPNDLHRAMIEAVDTEIGRLLEGLSPEVRNRTMIFVLGDNGTPGAALQGETPSPGRSKSTQYDGGIRIPFIVSGAGVARRGHTRDLAHVVDLFPTIADIAGVDTSQIGSAIDPTVALELDGVSLLAVLTDAFAPPPRRACTRRSSSLAGPAHSAPTSERSEPITTSSSGTKRVGSTNFFEYLPDAFDEGPDLLKKEPLTQDQQAAYESLSEQIDDTTSRLMYDASTWPESPSDVVPCVDTMDDDEA